MMATTNRDDAKSERETRGGDFLKRGGDESARVGVADEFERETEDENDDAVSADDVLAEHQFAKEGELLRELVLTAAELRLCRSRSGGVYGVHERGRRISMRTFIYFFAANRPDYQTRRFATRDTIPRLARQLDRLPPAAHLPLDLVRP